MGISGTTRVSLDQDQSTLLSLPLGGDAAVLGAAGTGKTTAVLAYLDHVLSTGKLTSGQTVVITPSRQSATALRDAVTLRLGVSTEGPIVRSIDSIAHELMSEAMASEVTLLTGSEQDTILAQLLEDEDVHASIPWPDFVSAEVRSTLSFRSELREFLMRMTELGVAPDDLCIRENAPEVWTAIAQFAKVYWRTIDLVYPMQFDSATMLAGAAEHVGSNRPSALADRISLIVVDDAQEMSRGFLNLLQSWKRRGSVGIVMAATPDTVAGSFRAVSVPVRETLSVLSIPEPLILTTSYRQSVPVAKAYSELVEHVLVSGPVGVRALQHGDAAGSEHLRRLQSPSAPTEARHIAGVLRDWHSLGGTPWEDMVVVTRTSRQSIELERALGRQGIPTRKDLSRIVLREDPGARWLLDAAMLAYTDDPFRSPSDVRAAAEHAERMLTSHLGRLDVLSLRRLKLGLRLHALSESGGEDTHAISSEALLCSAMAHPAEFDVVRDPVAREAARVARAIHDARPIAASQTVEDVLWHFWVQAGLQDAWLKDASDSGFAADDANRNLDAVVALQKAARRFVERRPTESGEVFLTELLEATVPDDSLAPARVAESVLVTTPAQLIGQEYEHVVVAGLQASVWPNLRPRNSLLAADLLDSNGVLPTDYASRIREVRSQEYSMFALAMSRARRHVVLSSVESEDETSSPLAMLGNAQIEMYTSVPSSLRGYVGMLRARLVDAHAQNRQDEEAAALLAELARAEIPGADPEFWFGLAEPSRSDPVFPADVSLSLSPSRIESLSTSSFVWFIDRIAPSPSEATQGVGVVIHKALELAGSDPSVTVEQLAKEVDRMWPQLRFPANWVAEGQRAKFQAALPNIIQYIQESTASGNTYVDAELKFEFSLEDNVIVRGRIDRMEEDSDGRLLIVDLKTGSSAPTGPSVQGHLQLAVYQLAVAEGAIEGQTSRESAGAGLLYPLLSSQLFKQAPRTQAELDALRATLRTLAAQVRAGKFLAPDKKISYLDTPRYQIHFIPEVSSS